MRETLNSKPSPFPHRHPSRYYIIWNSANGHYWANLVGGRKGKKVFIIPNIGSILPCPLDHYETLRNPPHQTGCGVLLKESHDRNTTVSCSEATVNSDSVHFCHVHLVLFITFIPDNKPYRWHIEQTPWHLTNQAPFQRCTPQKCILRLFARGSETPSHWSSVRC